MGAVVQLVRSEQKPKPEPWTLDDHAAFINKCFDDEARGERTAFRSRLKAGQALFEARKLVPPGEWGRWCDANIDRSRADIHRVMKMAGCPDPEAALLEERQKVAAQVKSTRAAARKAAANVSYVCDIEAPAAEASDPVRVGISTYRACSAEQRARFRAGIDQIDRAVRAPTK